MSGKPALTVIIPVYNRTQFVLDAVNSIINTNMNKNIVEILIITNIDLNINIEEENIVLKIIKTELPTLSEKVFYGIQHSSSEIVAILEDDDVWVNGKVDRIISIFNKYPDIVFYHNLSKKFHKENHISFKNISNKFLLCNSNEIKKSIKFTKEVIYKYQATYNLSSMVIRKNFIMKYINMLNIKATQGIDTLIFLISLAFGNYLFLDLNIGTMRRIHPFNSGANMNIEKTMDPNYFYDLKSLEFMKKVEGAGFQLLMNSHINTTEIIKECTNNIYSRLNLIYLYLYHIKISFLMRKLPDFWITVMIFSNLISHKLFLKINLLYYS